MDFFTNTLAQIGDLFRSMTPAARLTAGLLLAVLVVSLGYLFTYGGTSADQYLLAGQQFSPSEITAMAAAWGKAGLNDYEIVGNRVRVPLAKRDKYMGALLDEDALPQSWNDPLKKAMKNRSVFSSPRDIEDQDRVADEERMSLWIQEMSGIEKAGVLYKKREERGGLRPKTFLTAAVNVKPIGNATLTPTQVISIRRLVAAGNPGVKPDDVVVNDTNGISYGPGDIAGSPELINDRYFQATTAYENRLRQKVLDALSWIPGVRVQATVVLDNILQSREKTRNLDPKLSVPVASKESTGTITSVRRPSRGAPGYQANRPPNQATALTGSGGVASQEEEKTNESESVSLVSGKETESEIAGLTPKRESVSVSVPTEYLVKTWRERNPTPEGQDPAQPDAAALDMILRELSTKIKETAGQLVQIVDGTAPEDLITVNSFQSTPPEPLPEAGIATQTMGWIAGSWQTLVVIGLVIFSLMMLRSFLKSIPASAPSEPIAAAHESDADESDSGPDTVRFGGYSEEKSVRDELADMVKHDPDAAAAILRSWISTPA